MIGVEYISELKMNIDQTMSLKWLYNNGLLNVYPNRNNSNQNMSQEYNECHERGRNKPLIFRQVWWLILLFE